MAAVIFEKRNENELEMNAHNFFNQEAGGSPKRTIFTLKLRASLCVREAWLPKVSKPSGFAAAVVLAQAPMPS